MERVKEYILRYIQREYTVPEDIDIMNLNYMEEGYVDSLHLIHFIATIEDEFGISFTDDELSSPDIKVVCKMIDLVASKIQDSARNALTLPAHSPLHY